MKINKKLYLYPLSFVILSALSAYITLLLLTSGMTVQAPDLEGKSLKEAETLLDELGLYLKAEDEKFNQSIPAGNIVSQDVPFGSKVKKGDEIKVVLSKGPEIRLIPALAGEDIANAVSLLNVKGISILKTVRVHSDTTPEGRVIAQKPVPEEWAGEPLTLVVSSGPYDVIYYCPNFQSMTKEEALDLALQLGFEVGYSGPDRGKTVTGQTPAAGSEIKPGDTVYIQF